MKSKLNLINKLATLRGISDDCDKFIVHAMLAIERTEEEVVKSLLGVVTVEACLCICLLEQPSMTTRYSEAFIIEASSLLFKRTPYRFEA